MDRKTTYKKMSILSNLHTFNVIYIKIPAIFFCKCRLDYSEIYMESKGKRTANTIFLKKVGESVYLILVPLI